MFEFEVTIESRSVVKRRVGASNMGDALRVASEVTNDIQIGRTAPTEQSFTDVKVTLIGPAPDLFETEPF